MISAGHYAIASDLLDKLCQEVRKNCPQDSVAIADIAYLSGNLSLLRNDPHAALTRYREARAYATGLLQLSRIDQNTGSAFFMESDYGKASRYFSHALAELEYSRTFSPSRMLSLYDNLGASYFENGDPDAAGKWWDKAATVAGDHFSSDSLVLTGIFHNSGLVSSSRNDWANASSLFRKAMQVNPGSARISDMMNVMIRKNLSMSLMKEGKPAEAGRVLDLFMTADPFFCRAEPVLCAEIIRMKSWISFSSGRISEADSLLGKAGTMTQALPDGDSRDSGRLVRFRVQRDKAAMQYLQVSDLRQCDLEKANQVYSEHVKAIDLLQSFKGPDGSYPDYILLHDSIDILLRRTVETGFLLIPVRPGIAEDLLRFSGIPYRRHIRADAFSINSPVDAVPDSLADAWLRLNRQLYLQRKLEAGSGVTFRPSDPQVARRGFNMKNEFDSLTQRILERYPGRFLSFDQDNPENAGLSSRLSEDEAVIDYLVSPGWIYIFIVTSDSVILVRSAIDASFIDSLKGLLVALRTVDDLSFERNCPMVSQVLIQPVLPYLQCISRLYIVPDRELAGLPFECLTMPAKGYLAERFAISYHLSSEEVTPDICLDTERDFPGSDRPYDFLAFSPVFGDEQKMQRILNSADEVKDIGELFRNNGQVSKVFTDMSADETTLLQEIGKGKIIHIATHSKVDRYDPEQSGLHLWKQPPAVFGDELIDGILEMGEVKGLRFRCSLITLSSCTLGTWDSPDSRSSNCLEGDFLDAGADRLLHSLWNVSDRHTRTLMVDFYRFFLEGDGFPEALRKAKLKMLQNPATASPYFWAAFVLTTK
jgi:CHAT domain-containing protein/tetratricopeptide (TPR) repeat protein